MAKSQLKKLKESLKSHGLIGNDQTKKGRKNLDKHKSRIDRADAIQNIRAAFNPFDVKTTKQKQDVLGRKVIGAQGKPGISKQIGEEQRRVAYEAEMARKNKIGGVVDRRFGENDATLDPEEKMLARFTAEKLNQSRKSKSLFDLEDDEETDILTHYGKSLALEDDFDEDDIGLEEDDEELVQRIKRARGGDDGDEGSEAQPVKKSKKEVMEEIIAKSKAYKHERQQAKLEDQEKIQELDDDMDGLFEGLREAGSYTQNGESNSGEKNDHEVGYEKNLRELAFDRRAAPADRTKTEEELARQKAAQLVKLEKQRQARMEGEANDGVEDLGDDFANEDSDVDDARAFGLIGDQSEEEEADEFGEEPLFDEDNGDGEFAESPGENQEVDVVVAGNASRKPTAYVFPCPQTIGAFEKILSQHLVSDYPVIVERILTLHHPSVKEGNKEKLAVFSTVLAKLITQLPDLTTDSDVFDKLVKQFHKLAESYVEPLTQFFRDELLKISEKLGDKNRSSQEDGPAKCDLVVFALIGVLFSTSDHYHIVSTSATLLAAQYLSQNMLETTRDVSCGLYLCSVLLSYQRISKRFIPEVPVFLLRVIYGFFRHLADTVPVADVFLGERLAALPQLSQGLLDEVELSALSLTLLDETRQNDMSGIEELGQQLFLCAVDTISRLATLWNEKSAFIEVFTPFSTALAAIHTTNSHVQSARDKLERLLKFARQERRPLTLQSHRPVAIPSYAPKFEENYSLDRKSYDPDKDRQEIKKLKAQVKKERKATLRDIRRDTAFIAREKISTRREQDKQYHEKLARLERTIATEEGAEKNAYEREKKARKRANRK